MNTCRGSTSAEVAILVPTLFLLVTLVSGRGRIFDAEIMLRGAADVAARTASLSSIDRMQMNGHRAGISFVRDSGVPCRDLAVDVRREVTGVFLYTSATISCSIDHRDLGGLMPKYSRLRATSREIVDYFRSDR